MYTCIFFFAISRRTSVCLSRISLSSGIQLSRFMALQKTENKKNKTEKIQPRSTNQTGTSSVEVELCFAGD